MRVVYEEPTVSSTVTVSENSAPTPATRRMEGFPPPVRVALVAYCDSGRRYCGRTPWRRVHSFGSLLRRMRVDERTSEQAVKELIRRVGAVRIGGAT